MEVLASIAICAASDSGGMKFIMGTVDEKELKKGKYNLPWNQMIFLLLFEKLEGCFLMKSFPMTCQLRQLIS